MRSFVRLGVLVAAAWALGGATSGTAANWPRFRGPNGTGTASATDIPVQFGEKDGILWKVPLPGLGNSSPIIWGGHLFLQSASEKGNERYLLCLQVADGKLVWQRPVPGKPARVNAKNSLASATPATDGERVYAAFWDGDVVSIHAFSMTGEPLWQSKIGSFKSQHGAAASPVVDQGRVFFLQDEDGAAMLHALDAKTGKSLWQMPRKPFRACYSVPYVRERPDQGRELVVASTAGVSGYNPQNGVENWHFDWAFSGPALRTVGSPVAAHGLIYVTSGDGGGNRHAIAIREGASGDVSKTNLVWEQTKMFPYVPTMLTHGDHLYYVNDDGFAGCHDARTGERVWYERLVTGKSVIAASPVLINDKVYAPDIQGTVHVFAAAPAFKPLAKNNLGEDILASPAVADNRLYVRGKKHLFCITKPPAR